MESAPESYFNAQDAAEGALPAWFIPRMMDNSTGAYCLMLSTGLVMAVQRIDRLHRASDGGLWLDVELAERPAYASERKAGIFYAQSHGQEATVNASHVVTAFEFSPGQEPSNWDGTWLHASGKVNL